ncbi:MAG: disulfide bond formation protein B [Rhodobacteraceae bacterium]|nr:disulfide bond formation protein B [Paracoccaceae bacterium]MCW9043644.1 disulfide bond formation protein B [Pseudopelagicola sp.]
MILTKRTLILALTAFSLFSNIAALGFQHIGGLDPCAMCFWQRYPHWTAVLFGALALWFGSRVWPLLAGLSAFTTAAIAAYHSGVERKWWDGPASCTGRGLSNDGSGNLLDFANAKAPALCDEIPWDIFGISMANLNALGSFVVALLWVYAAFMPASGRRIF